MDDKITKAEMIFDENEKINGEYTEYTKTVKRKLY